MPVAAVFTATGTQGSAVLTALAERFGKSLAIRALTRNPSSPRTTAALAKYADQADITPVQADWKDPASIKTALDGVDVVFANSNSFDDIEGEVEQGKRVIDVAQQAGVKLFVWSTLPDADKESNGKYKGVHHFQNKAEIQAYLEKSSLKWASVSLGFFAENIINYHLIQPADDKWKIAFPVLKPDTDVAWAWVGRDLGPAVAALFKAHLDNAHADLFGKIWPLASYQGSFTKLGQILTQRTGKEVIYETPAQAQSEDLKEMSEFYNDFGYFRGTQLPPREFVALGVPFSTLEQFVDEQVLPALNYKA